MEPQETDRQEGEVRSKFQRYMNEHGFGFQYRLIREIKRLAEKNSKWQFRAAEFPVEVHGQATQIDVLLDDDAPYNANRLFRYFIVGECKRVNPAMGRWCFIRAPYTRGDNPTDHLILESVRSNGEILKSNASEGFRISDSAYHIALPVKTDQRGDAQPRKAPREEIANALEQVLRGVNGFANMLAARPNLIGDRRAVLIPAVFTTAQLWVSDTSLSSADLNTGNIELESKPLKQVNWLWVQSITSPGLAHSVPRDERPNDDIEKLMAAEFIRSVAIVNSRGLGQFLEYANDYIRRD